MVGFTGRALVETRLTVDATFELCWRRAWLLIQEVGLGEEILNGADVSHAASCDGDKTVLLFASVMIN